MSKLKGLWIGLGVAALVAAFLIASLGKTSHRGQLEVRLDPVRRNRIESWVRAPGQVRPVRLVQISSNVMGRVQDLSVQEGSVVHKGDFLMRLDDELYRSELAGMQAQVEGARADLTLADAQRARSHSELERQKRIYADSLLSPDAFEQTKMTAAVDEAHYASVKETLKQQQAVLAEAKKNLRETTFYAPINGVVTVLNVEEGENVVTGTMNNPGTVILTLADLDTMEVEADVDESDVVRVRPQQSARIKVDAWEDSVLTGQVTSVGMSGRKGAESTQQQATSFDVKVRIVNPPDGLRPGMTAEIQVLSGEKDSALVVPIQALTAHPEKVVMRWAETASQAGSKRRAGVSGAAAAEESAADTADSAHQKMIEGIFIDRGGKARFVPVRLGLRGDTDVEIEANLKPGDQVVSGPYRILRKLKDGDSIRQEKPKKVSTKEPTGEADHS